MYYYLNESHAVKLQLWGIFEAKDVAHRVRQEFNHIDYKLGSGVSATVTLHPFSIWFGLRPFGL